MANFIEILSQATTGTLGALSRSIMIVTREAVTGFVADAETGLFKIQSTDVAAFEAANPSSLGLINSLRTVFAGSIKPDYVYILSSVTAVTNAMLDKANARPRDWSFITLCSESQGIDDETTYMADLTTIATWATPAKQKIVVHTFSAIEIDEEIALPASLVLGGSINSNANVKTIVSNSSHELDVYTTVYDNIALAWLAFVLYGGVISRSWGSLSDAHDFPYILSDSYSQTVRNYIESNSLAQYNGSKDRAGSLFVYDTQMNDGNNPPLSYQIESLAAQYYIDDYSYVYVRNTLQAAGETGLPCDDGGIQKFASLVDKALRDCFDLNLILAKENGQPDYTLAVKTAAQVTQLAPDWQKTGKWPAGVVIGKIRPFAAAHYVTIVFQYQ